MSVQPDLFDFGVEPERDEIDAEHVAKVQREREEYARMLTKSFEAMGIAMLPLVPDFLEVGNWSRKA